MWNIILEERSRSTRAHGEWDSDFFRLKRHSTYDYIHDNSLPGQGQEKIVYIFKMSTCGVASGVDIVKRMQPRGDLQYEWVMYDHIKRMVGWTTMGIHIYDPEFRKVVTIAVSDMQCEAQDAQVQMWQSLLQVIEAHGYFNITFKGFMADSAQTDFNAKRIVLDLGIQRFQWKIKNELVSFTGRWHWNATRSN